MLEPRYVSTSPQSHRHVLTMGLPVVHCSKVQWLNRCPTSGRGLLGPFLLRDGVTTTSNGSLSSSPNRSSTLPPPPSPTGHLLVGLRLGLNDFESFQEDVSHHL